MLLGWAFVDEVVLPPPAVGARAILGDAAGAFQVQGKKGEKEKDVYIAFTAQSYSGGKAAPRSYCGPR